MGHRPLQVVWRKRRYHCLERRCAQRFFTERSAQVLPRHRLTQRLRDKLERSASGSARSLADVAGEYDVSWWSVNKALVTAAVERRSRRLPEVRMLGLDETRARSMRWVWEGSWRLSNPWMTSFVDLDLGRPGWLLGVVSGLSGAAVETWLAAQPAPWRAGIEVVARDPSVPFVAAIRRLGPQATIVVDHWLLVHWVHGPGPARFGSRCSVGRSTTGCPPVQVWLTDGVRPAGHRDEGWLQRGLLGSK